MSDLVVLNVRLLKKFLANSIYILSTTGTTDINESKKCFENNNKNAEKKV